MYMTKIFIQSSFENPLANQSQTLCGAKFGRGMKVCINSQVHMTKMATMAINSKNLYNFLLQNQKAYYFELGMKHQGRKLYKFI